MIKLSLFWSIISHIVDFCLGKQTIFALFTLRKYVTFMKEFKYVKSALGKIYLFWRVSNWEMECTPFFFAGSSYGQI